MLVSGIVAAVWTATSFFAGSHLYFPCGVAPKLGPSIKVEAVVLSIAMTWSAINFVWRWIVEYRTNRSTYQLWLRASLVLLAVNTVLLVAIWPGFWIWDEFHQLNLLHNGSVSLWVGLPQVVYYISWLHLIPTGAALPVIQILFAAAVGGYVVYVASCLVHRRWLAWLAGLPFLLPPVLLNNSYPFRMTLYSYVMVAVVFRIIHIANDRSKIRSWTREIIVFGIAVAFLAFWRSEGLYWLVALPVLWIAAFKSPKYQKHGRPQHRSCRGQVLAGAAASVAIVLAVAIPTQASTSPAYQVTATLNPLSLMLRRDLSSPNLEQDLDAISKVWDLDAVRKYASARDIVPFWHGALRPEFETYLPGYNRAVVDLIMHNPRAFMSARLKTFKETNSLGNYPGQIRKAANFWIKVPPAQQKKLDTFAADNIAGAPIDESARGAVVRTLLMVSPTGRVLHSASIVWSVIPVLVLLALAWIVALFRRRWLSLSLASVPPIHAALVFVSAPASLFMYYLPVYLVGCALLTHWAARALDSRNQGSLACVNGVIRRVV